MDIDNDTQAKNAAVLREGGRVRVHLSQLRYLLMELEVAEEVVVARCVNAPNVVRVELQPED